MIRKAKHSVSQQIDTRLSALDGAGEIELSMLEASTEGKIIVYGADGVANDVAMNGACTIAANGAVQIATGAVDSAQIATDAVDSAEIKAGAVGSAEIATDAVGSDEIAAGAVGFAELAAANIVEKIRFQLPQGDIAATDFQYVIGMPKHAGRVTAIKLIPNSTFGQATNNSVLTVYNRGAADDGTTALCTQTFDDTHQATARVAFDFTLDGTPTNLDVVAADVLTLVKTHNGDGQVVPAGVLEITYSRSA